MSLRVFFCNASVAALKCVSLVMRISPGVRPSKKETQMPKYLLQVNYVGDGVKGLLKDGGTRRQAAATKLVKSLGGKMEAFYYAFGESDAIVIAELPDNVSMAALGLTLAASGVVASKTTVLLTPKEIDAATKKKPSYTPPGKK